MVGNLDIADGEYDDAGAGPSHPSANNSPYTTKQTIHSLPTMGSSNTASILTIPTKGGLGGSRNHQQHKRRGSSDSSHSIFSYLSGGAEEEYDYACDDLKAQARAQQARNSNSLFSSITSAYQRKPSQEKKKTDPLMDFHERRNRAVQEYDRQEEARKRREQIRDFDDEKSVASSGSFFDFLTRTGAADDLASQAGAPPDAYTKRDTESTCDLSSGGMKRVSSTHSMASTAASFFGLFGDDEAEIAKLSATNIASQRHHGDVAAGEEKDPTLQEAVNKSKSVKGQRVFNRGTQAAEEGNWKKAVAYYHIALVKQRKYYGEDHIVTSNTLNALGLALMHLGEHFGALTALEEALHIRQELLGAGAEEVAETTTHIWKVLKASQDEESANTMQIKVKEEG